MKTFRIVRIGVLTFVLTAIASGQAAVVAQADPQVGTWVLDVAQSKYTPGPAPRSQTAIYSAAGQGLKVVATGTDAAGKPTTTEFTLNFDGKDYPAKGSADFDSIAAKRVDSHTLEYTRKRGGKAGQTATRVVSKDGKTATLTVTGVNGQGVKISNIAVYVRK